ncbi:MAG: hypothetical protein ISP90_12870 [Nevskia sp.]|nr:hypothetical protein [Nevskia sp.]
MTLPRKILRALGWVEGATRVTELYADLVEEGRIRLRLAADVQARLDVLRVQLGGNGAEHDEVRDRIAALYDRHRRLAFDPKAGRVQLTDAVTTFLPAELETTLYAEPQGAAIDLLTLARRARRLKELARFTSLPMD